MPSLKTQTLHAQTTSSFLLPLTDSICIILIFEFHSDKITHWYIPSLSDSFQPSVGHSRKQLYYSTNQCCDRQQFLRSCGFYLPSISQIHLLIFHFSYMLLRMDHSHLLLEWLWHFLGQPSWLLDYMCSILFSRCHLSDLSKMSILYSFLV